MSALSTKDFEPYFDRPSLILDDPDSLAALENSPEIEVLTIYRFVKVYSLEPLRKLRYLRALLLHSQPSWDGTNRHLLVKSFDPLASLEKLELFSILGVVPEKDRLDPLRRIPSLRKVSIGNTNFYQLEDFAALSVALPHARKTLQPVFQMNFITTCRKCGKYHLLFLEGAKPRCPRYVCPACGRKKIIAHLARWNAAGGMPQYPAAENLSPFDLLEKFRNPCAT